MKILDFNNSVKISTVTYFATSLIGLILYLQIFSLFDLNTLGKFSVYQTICFFGSKFISLSTPYSLMKHVSQDNKERVNLNYLTSALFIVLFFFTSVYVLFSIDNIFIFFQKIPYIEVVLLLSATIFLQASNFLIKTFFNSCKDFIHYNISFVLRPSIFVVTIYLFYKEIISDFYLAFFFTELLLIIFNVFLLLSRLKYYYLSSLVEAFFNHLKYMKTSFITSIFTEIYFKIDIYCIAVILGEYYSGIYALIAVIGEGLTGLIYVIRNNLTPYITNKNINEKSLEIRNHLRSSFKVSNIIAFVTSFSTLIVVIFGSRKIDILTPLYEDGFEPLVIVLLGFSIMSFFLTLENVLLQLGSHGYHAVGLIILTSLNIFLNFALIEYKLVGIVIGTVFSYLIFIIYILIIFKYKFKYSFLSLITSTSTNS
tara:strand:- start:1516 stop:2793 length:1278 start_codon:yes stop_codon:yes gene_type:complete